MVYRIFCGQCDALLLDEPRCAQCGWQRPGQIGQTGEEIADPLPLGRSVSGTPAQIGDMIWYAAPPEDGDVPGSLIALHGQGHIVRRHTLGEFAPPPALPAAFGLASDRDHVFVGLRDFAVGERRSSKDLLALESRTGKAAWAVPTPSRELSSPALQDGLVYVAGASPEAVYAVDATRRRLRWTAYVAADCRYYPVVAEAVVVAIGGAILGPAYLLGLDRTTGREQWRHRADSGFGQPTTDGELIFVASERALKAYEAAGGHLRWQYADVRRTSTGVATAAPVVAGDFLLLPTGAGDRSVPHYALDALDRASGRRCWRFPLPDRSGRIKVSPTVFGDTVIVAGGSGHIYALALQSGALHWQTKLKQRLAAPPLTESDVLFLPSRDGLLYRVRWQPASSAPLETAEVYEARGEWETAAVAYALGQPPNLKKAGQCMLRAGEAEKAAALFEAAGDRVGGAQALAMLGRYEGALELLPEGEEEELKASWYEKVGRHDRAADVYTSLRRWTDAAAAYERADRPLKAIEAYKKAGREEDAHRLAAQIDLKSVDKLVSLLGWQVAAERYEKAGHLAAAADLYEEHGAWQEALDLRLEEENWMRVREICRKTGDWEREAQACLRLADSLPGVQIRVDGPAQASGQLSEELYQQVRRTFLECPHFSSNRELSSLFADPRLVPWRHRVARKETTAGRVDALLAYLPQQSNQEGQNGLVLFTRVLASHYDPQDQLHQRLLVLAEQVERSLAPQEASPWQEIDSVEAARWRVSAGDLYASHRQWEAAERCYRQAGHIPKWADTLAEQGRWQEAGDLLVEEKTGFAQAATYYWRAAEAAQALVPDWQPRKPGAAALYSQAERCCLYAGHLEALFICRTMADRCLQRPRLVLGQGTLEAPFQQGITSRFTLPVHNMGYGPAASVQLWACGSALKRTKENAIAVSPVVNVIPEGSHQDVAIALEPVAAGHEGVPLQIEFYIRYEDVVQEKALQEDGPHEINQPVLHASAEAMPAQALTLRAYYQGSYVADRTQVDLLKTAKEAISSGRAETIILEQAEE